MGGTSGRRRAERTSPNTSATSQGGGVNLKDIVEVWGCTSRSWKSKDQILLVKVDREGPMTFQFFSKPIGIQFTKGWRGRREVVRVRSVFKGASAEAAGIRPG